MLYNCINNVHLYNSKKKMYKKIFLLLVIPGLANCMEIGNNYKQADISPQYAQDIIALFEPLSDLDFAEELIKNKRYMDAIKLLSSISIKSDNQYLRKTLFNRRKLLQSIACYQLGSKSGISNQRYFIRESMSLLEEVLNSTQPTDEYHKSALEIKKLFKF